MTSRTIESDSDSLDVLLRAKRQNWEPVSNNKTEQLLFQQINNKKSDLQCLPMCNNNSFFY